jgi:hypothetical protein
MEVFNWILTKLALVLVLICIAAAIDIPNNPARYLFRTVCQTVRSSGDGYSR